MPTPQKHESAGKSSKEGGQNAHTRFSGKTLRDFGGIPQRFLPSKCITNNSIINGLGCNISLVICEGIMTYIIIYYDI